MIICSETFFLQKVKKNAKQEKITTQKLETLMKVESVIEGHCSLVSEPDWSQTVLRSNPGSATYWGFELRPMAHPVCF